MPRDCLICLDGEKTKVVAELIATGVSDRAIARQIGGMSHMSVARHRQNHVARPAQAFARAAARTHEIRAERERAIQAAESGDLATAFLGLERIAADLRRVQERLERTAEAAETDQQRLAVASLSGQQLRAAEVRAKLGGVGAYAPPRGVASDAPKFELNIIFSGGRTQRIEGMPMHPDDPAFNALPTLPFTTGGDAGVDGIGAVGPMDGSRDDEEMFDEDL
jgi:hypothetical protein